MLQPCWEDELVVATFSNGIFGHTSSPWAIPIRIRCLRPQLSLCRNPPVRAAWQIHPLGVTGVTDTSQQGAGPVLGSILHPSWSILSLVVLRCTLRT